MNYEKQCYKCVPYQKLDITFDYAQQMLNLLSLQLHSI